MTENHYPVVFSERSISDCETNCFSSLDDYILLSILQRVHPQDYFSISNVNVSFYCFLSDPCIWRLYFKSELSSEEALQKDTFCKYDEDNHNIEFKRKMYQYLRIWPLIEKLRRAYATKQDDRKGQISDIMCRFATIWQFFARYNLDLILSKVIQLGTDLGDKYYICDDMRNEILKCIQYSTIGVLQRFEASPLCFQRPVFSRKYFLVLSCLPYNNSPNYIPLIKAAMVIGNPEMTEFLISVSNLGRCNFRILHSEFKLFKHLPISQVVQCYELAVQSYLKKPDDEDLFGLYSYLHRPSTLITNVPGAFVHELVWSSDLGYIQLVQTLCKAISPMSVYQVINRFTPVPLDIDTSTKQLEDIKKFIKTYMEVRQLTSTEFLKNNHITKVVLTSLNLPLFTYFWEEKLLLDSCDAIPLIRWMLTKLDIRSSWVSLAIPVDAYLKMMEMMINAFAPHGFHEGRSYIEILESRIKKLTPRFEDFEKVLWQKVIQLINAAEAKLEAESDSMYIRPIHED